MRPGKCLVSILASIAFAAMPALGADRGWYIGASAGQAKAEGLEARKLPVSVLPGSLTTSIDDKDTAGKVLAGYRFTPFLSAEVVYADYGSTRLDSGFTAQRTGTLMTPGTASVDRSVKSLGIDVLGGLRPVESVWIYGRLGWVQAEVESVVTTNLEATVAEGSFFSDTGPGLSRTRKSRKGSAKYGAGVEWSPMSSVGVRLEWERVDKVGDPYQSKGPDLRGFPLYYLDQGTGEGGVDMWSVGIVWRF